MVGEKRHRVSLQQRSVTLDADGEDVRTYTTLANVWASVRAVEAREAFESAQVQADVSHRIDTRYATAFAAMTPADRLLVGGRVFEVVSVTDPDGRRKALRFLCKERI